MTIAELKQIGSGVILENLEVANDYGLKAGQTPHRAILVKDGSDQTIIKLWGAASGTPYNPGDIIMVKTAGPKGRIETNEYPAGSGKVTFNCNDCEVVLINTNTAAAPQAAAPTTFPPAPTQTTGVPSPVTRMNKDQTRDYVAARVAEYIKLYTPFIQTLGMTPDGIGQMAVGSARLEPMHFFGEKFLKD